MTARKGKESQPKPRRESASKSASGESAQNGHPMDRRQHQNRRHLNVHRTQSYRFVIHCLCELLGQLVIVLVVFFLSVGQLVALEVLLTERLNG